MSLRTSSKSSLFLIELIIVILFFSIAGAVCVSIFAQSHLISTESAELTMAVTRCQNAAEVLHSVGNNPQKLEALLGAKFQENGEFSVSYDLLGDPSPHGRYVLRFILESAPPNRLNSATIIMEDSVDKEAIYTLNTVYRS